MELTVAKHTVEIKFDFKTMFKINNKLGSVNKDTGERNADGVGALFYKILERDDSALMDLIRLSSTAGKKAPSDDEILDAIADIVEEEGTTENLFKELEDDMVASGFFKEKISKYIDNMETSVKYLETREDEDTAQIALVKDMIGKMRDAIS